MVLMGEVILQTSSPELTRVEMQRPVGQAVPFVVGIPYRGTSLIRNIRTPRITIDPSAYGYCRVLQGGGP